MQPRPNIPARQLSGAVKVPAVTVLFWVVKALTTGTGEAGSDFLAGRSLVLAGVLGLGGFALSMVLQFRATRYVPAVYWFAVAMVAVFGTEAADALHKGLGIPYLLSTCFYAVVLAGVFGVWYRVEGTLSIHSITSGRREMFYWLTVLTTFALGTAAGDWTASTLRLGFFSSGVLFGILILLPALGWARLRLNPIVSFWIAYVLTRPLGASVADWFAKPHSFNGGLGYGDGTVTLIATGAILVGVAVLARRATPA